ncbi:hypothetical protein AI2BBH_10520 [Alistipes indistinctus]|nr:hypothetical protein AI2BBH_10520 [Alistipes indistinctus]
MPFIVTVATKALPTAVLLLTVVPNEAIFDAPPDHVTVPPEVRVPAPDIAPFHP